MLAIKDERSVCNPVKEEAGCFCRRRPRILGPFGARLEVASAILPPSGRSSFVFAPSGRLASQRLCRHLSRAGWPPATRHLVQTARQAHPPRRRRSSNGDCGKQGTMCNAICSPQTANIPVALACASCKIWREALVLGYWTAVWVCRAGDVPEFFVCKPARLNAIHTPPAR